MTQPEQLDATTDVVTLAEHVDGFGTNVAQRLEDHGIETVADILIGEREALLDIPYVSDLRASTLQNTAEEIVGVLPRRVDFEATESVVSEAAIPLSVRRGDAVLAPSGATGTNGVYHTSDCSVVKGKGEYLREREWTWVEERDVDECGACSDSNVHGTGAKRNASELEALVNSREIILEATLGEKLQITLAERASWVEPWVVIEAFDPVGSKSEAPEACRTRRLRCSTSPTGKEDARELDLVLACDEIRVEDPPVKRRSAQPNAPSWRVESVGAVGRVSTTSLIQLQADDEEKPMPEGDDTWRKYQRGEA